MTPGDVLISSIPLKAEFYDRHERRAYFRAVEIAKHIVNDPAVITNAARFLELHVRPDIRQRVVYETWTALLTQQPDTIVRALLEDSDRGAELRKSAPVFVVVGDRRTELLR